MTKKRALIKKCKKISALNCKQIKNVCLKEYSIVLVMGQELLSASLEAAVCQDSKVFLTL